MSAPFSPAAAMDMNAILAGCGILIPFGLGVVAGIFGIAKLVEIIFEAYVRRGPFCLSHDCQPHHHDKKEKTGDHMADFYALNGEVIWQ